MSEIETSPLIENSAEVKKPEVKKPSYTYVLVVVVILLMMFLCFHAYTCFHTNQNMNFLEPYINGPPRTDTQADKPFDVDKEVKKLIQMQERFLEKLEQARRGN